MLAVNDLAIYILSVPNYRNVDGLINTLKETLGVHPKLVNAFTPDDLHCSNSTNHHHYGKVRSISCTEFAAALSHARARELALSTGIEWNLFLEDDSVPLNLDLRLELERCTQLNRAIGIFIHLFPEQNGVLKHKPNSEFLEILKMPDYANAYLLNRKALEELQELTPKSHLFLADWPEFPISIRKLALRRSIFSHPPQDEIGSQIEDSRRLIQKLRRSYRTSYLIQQYFFRTFARAFKGFGDNSIANENLRSIIL